MLVKLSIIVIIMILSTNLGYAEGISLSHVAPDGAYYVGDWKDMNGKIMKNCYAKVFHDELNSIYGTSIICITESN